MTSTVGRNSRAGTDAHVTDALEQSVVSLSPPTRRRPGWIALGALLVGLSGLLGAYVFSVVTDTLTVTVASRDIAPGEILQPSDVRVVEMGRTSDLRAVQADQQDLILGLAARGPIPAGTVLNTGLFVPGSEVIPEGKVVVGGLFAAGAVPTAALRPGDEITLLRVASEREQLSAGSAGSATVLGSAIVWALEGEVSTESASQRLWVSLLIDATIQGEVAQAASDEVLRIVLTGSP
jgi:hypothetical protein